jgi:hypothetical protein
MDPLRVRFPIFERFERFLNVSAPFNRLLMPSVLFVQMSESVH